MRRKDLRGIELCLAAVWVSMGAAAVGIAELWSSPLPAPDTPPRDVLWLVPPPGLYMDDTRAIGEPDATWTRGES